MSKIEYQCLTGGDAAEVLSDEYVNLYLANYDERPYLSGPLYSRERFLDRTGEQMKNPSFVLVSARDDYENELLGFAFGLMFEAGQWWGEEAAPAAPDMLAAQKFAVAELNVRWGQRRHGLGKTLLATLLAQQEAPYATLLASPDAPAHAMLQRWGWQVVGPAHDDRTSDILVLALDAGS
ncbi:GNAT family N-acetyltransferase [Streptosporangium sp. NPDC000563]|uniref:GNAT family N-acetyltransferase n=1 Tax=Streptosporangium sp. NPDC000563 TaxID=3154366 RepID=UPI003317A05D